jgi:5'-nucleotidase
MQRPVRDPAPRPLSKSGGSTPHRAGGGYRTRIRRAALAAGTAGAALAGLTAIGPAQAAPRPVNPVDLQILSINDYHGYLDPPTGSDGKLPTASGPIDAGGVEYLSTHLSTLRTGHANTVTVSAGDLIGGSPFLSGLFKDEPSIASLNSLKLDVSAIGNHELDEGVPELLRMQYGGCHPVEGCFDAAGYPGASFRYLSANVIYRRGVKPARPANARHYGEWFDERTGRTILPPSWVKNVGGIKVGFIGLTLRGADELVAQAGIKDIQFGDEIAAADLAARDLRKEGVRAIVLLLHEGGLAPSGSTYDFACNPGGGPATITGPVVTLAQKIDPSIDLIVTGHSHNSYLCNIPDPAGNPRHVTSASSYGRLVTETNLQLDPRTRDVIRSSVTSVNRPVTRDVPPGRRPGRDDREVGGPLRPDRRQGGRHRHRPDHAERHQEHRVRSR